MKKVAFWLLVLALIGAPTLAWAEDPPEDEPADEPADEMVDEEETDEPVEPEEPELEWLDDYEEAQAKAKEAGKGLFVYLTPDWFT